MTFGVFVFFRLFFPPNLPQEKVLSHLIRCLKQRSSSACHMATAQPRPFDQSWVTMETIFFCPSQQGSKASVALEYFGCEVHTIQTGSFSHQRTPRQTHTHPSTHSSSLIYQIYIIFIFSHVFWLFCARDGHEAAVKGRGRPGAMSLPSSSDWRVYILDFFFSLDPIFKTQCSEWVCGSHLSDRGFPPTTWGNATGDSSSWFSGLDQWNTE